MPIAISLSSVVWTMQLAALGLENRRVAQPHAVGLRDGRLAVRIDGAHLEQRVASAHHFQHIFDAPAVGILATIEVGELDRLLQLVDHGHRLARRREDLLAGEIEVQVVQTPMAVLARTVRATAATITHVL